jgi:hypothetical protein
MERQRRTLESDAISTKSHGTTLMNVSQNSHWWSRSKTRQIINADPTSTVMNATIEPEEPIDLEEGVHLFHSQKWVKGTRLHFIVDREIQKNLISEEVIKQLGLSKKPHP